MNNSRLHQNQWAYRRELDRVELHLDLRDPLGDGEVGIRAVGRSEMRRGALWTYQETFLTSDDDGKGYGPADALHHIALVTLQDRPPSLDALDFALKGGVSYHEPRMF